MTMSEKEFIDKYRRLAPESKYALAYVTYNMTDGMTFEEMKAIGNQKIAEYRAGVIDEKYVIFANA